MLERVIKGRPGPIEQVGEPSMFVAGPNQCQFIVVSSRLPCNFDSRLLNTVNRSRPSKFVDYQSQGLDHVPH